MKYILYLFSLAVVFLCGGMVPCAMADDELPARKSKSVKVADADDSESDAEEPKSQKILGILQQQKRISGKINPEAKAYVVIAITDHYVKNLCGGYAVSEDPKEVTTAFKKSGLAKHMKKLQKMKEVQIIFAVEEGASIKDVKKNFPKWYGIKCPIIEYKPAEFTEIADVDIVTAYSHDDKHIRNGYIDMSGHNMGEFVIEMKAWLEENAD